MLPLSQEDNELINQLNRHPDIKDRVKSIVSIANNDGDGIVTADEAESRVIEEVRRMGNEVLTGWAESRVEKGVIKSAVFDTLRRSFYIIPILFPVPVCTINSQGEHNPGIFQCPPCTGYFQTLLNNVPMRTLYFA